MAAATFRRPLAWKFGFRIVVSLFQEWDFKSFRSGEFGFQYFRLRNFPISRFPASGRQDFNISKPRASKSKIFNGSRGSLILAFFFVGRGIELDLVFGFLKRIRSVASMRCVSRRRRIRRLEGGRLRLKRIGLRRSGSDGRRQWVRRQLWKLR